ncbi:DNA helicase UvrD [Blastococcus sp. MG754426]|uniref:UvrD-helicase domain-containing protein n=1 Tax=unclassified Blastococcus TaxID=2619396 RepID=UPI001EF08960|nr:MULTISPECIES: UvrD-helicase domain-containing protein [unclassified Blastococcus]MCF6508326.1 DNA helicase UvrD [Blastococcus sp. MG754426]MCF6513034.1 DNA helicase UvrD [Blastococcus sp. MG754427]MCF6734079.1 DNA helicase UvrD [Blastococcus sp. KM273129]
MNLNDDAARRAIREDLDRTLFVEAGAGSGKTTCLVDRITALVTEARVPMRSVAAVTFTEKAGAELRDRLRSALERDDGELAQQALDDLDGAAIGTLHSFAQRILGEHPIEAGLPPLLEVADELSSSVAFEERWAEQRTRLLDDDAIAHPLLLAMSAGVTLDHLRSLTKLFNADWDLVSERVLTDEQLPVPELRDLDDLVRMATELAGRTDECTDAADKFLPDLTSFGAWGTRLGAAVDAAQRLEVLREAAELKHRYGQAKNWGGKAALDGIKDACKQLIVDADAVVKDVLETTLRLLSRWIAARVIDAAQERKAAGRLEFHDLLVISRDLLRHQPAVRAALHDRYSHLLLDEFQDTDPIQIELAVRIAGGAEASQEQWEDVVVPPGSLFVVGDPKQSIYRFRRADIAMYLRSQRVIGTEVSLTSNFRTTEPILSWVNDVFGRLIVAEPDRQPEYRALDAVREPLGNAPSVVALSAEAHTDKLSAAELRELEAADVAGVVRRAITEAWQVCDDETKEWRPARLDDIAILVPARTSLPFLEEALDDAGIPYRAEASSLVYEAQEVRDLLAAARAVADPSDGLALVTALRSPLFGCGDDDLWTWKRDGGVLNLLAPVADDRRDHPVAQALAYLRRLHNDSRWLSPAEVLAALVADRRMLEVAATSPRARDQWRRLRFVVDQARAWSESEHGGLRAYLAWAELHGQESSRVVEASLPETDASAVRIMTIHAAKGLEFPIVVMSGLTAGPRSPSGVRVLWPASGGYEVSLRKGVTTGDFDAAQPVDEQMDERERRRLLYVAATRARDHLVVSLHRSAVSRTETAAKLIADAGGSASGAESWSVAELGDGSSVFAEPVAPRVPEEYGDWLAELTRVRSASGVASAVSASGLEGTEPSVAFGGGDTGSAKGALNVELPAWSKGRYGTAIGRAVHGVLQQIDLATGSGLDDAVAAQCVAEGVEMHADVVTALVRSALESEIVQRAAAREHWREMYVGTVQDDGTVLEGYVDLVYREDDGSLVVIDYKTDAIPAEAVAARAQYYAPQLRSYATVLSAATGNTAVDLRLAFLNPVGSVVAGPPSG